MIDTLERLIGRRFRDARSGAEWTFYRSEGLLPEQVITIKSTPTPGSGLRANWSVDLTMVQLLNYLRHAQWVDGGPGVTADA